MKSLENVNFDLHTQTSTGECSRGKTLCRKEGKTAVNNMVRSETKYSGIERVFKWFLLLGCSYQIR